MDGKLAMCGIAIDAVISHDADMHQMLDLKTQRPMQGQSADISGLAYKAKC